MGGPVEQSRIFRLRHLAAAVRVQDGSIQLARCSKCGHQGPIPIDRLLARCGELMPVEAALSRLKCLGCGERGQVQLRFVRICAPGCPRNRG